jgi:hypothetical protein
VIGVIYFMLHINEDILWQRHNDTANIKQVHNDVKGEVKTYRSVDFTAKINEI